MAGVLDNGHAHHLPHQEGDEHEVLARQAQNDGADQGGDGGGQRGADQEADRPGHVEAHDHDGRAVGTEAHEGRVA